MAWYRQVRRADWATPADVKRAIGNASILNDGRAVFNIAGNKYRIVVWINYPYRVALFMSGSSERTGSTTRSMHKPFEGRRHGHFTDQEPARLS
jgi:hypothetical protein